MRSNNPPQHIVLTEPLDFPAEATYVLQRAGRMTLGPFTRMELLSLVADATVLFVRLGHNIDREILSSAPQLRYIVTATTGLNHIDLDAAQEKGIEVLSLKGETEFLETISPTADLTFGLILSLVRNIPAAVSHTQSGFWNRDLFKGYDLRGRTLGIYGCGRIGRKVARMGQAFDMNVIAYDIAPQDLSAVEFIKEAELLSHSDILSLHIPYEDKLKSFFDAAKFSQMKKGSYFINTARGELVNESALLSALDDGTIKGAALDVLDGEYGADKNWANSNALIQYATQHSNLIITPHIGGASYDSMARVEIFMAEKLLASLSAA